jgi:hypothetical protein
LRTFNKEISEESAYIELKMKLAAGLIRRQKGMRRSTSLVFSSVAGERLERFEQIPVKSGGAQWETLSKSVAERG